MASTASAAFMRPNAASARRDARRCSDRVASGIGKAPTRSHVVQGRRARAPRTRVHRARRLEPCRPGAAAPTSQRIPRGGPERRRSGCAPKAPDRRGGPAVAAPPLQKPGGSARPPLPRAPRRRDRRGSVRAAPRLAVRAGSARPRTPCGAALASGALSHPRHHDAPSRPPPAVGSPPPPRRAHVVVRVGRGPRARAGPPRPSPSSASSRAAFLRVAGSAAPRSRSTRSATSGHTSARAVALDSPMAAKERDRMGPRTRAARASGERRAHRLDALFTACDAPLRFHPPHDSPPRRRAIQ